MHRQYYLWRPCRIYYSEIGNTFLKSNSFYRASKGEDVEVEDELDLYSYKWEHLTKAEQNNALHESYQFLIKKFISKEERKKMKDAKDAKAAEAMASTLSAFGFGGGGDAESMDSKIDFSHLNNWIPEFTNKNECIVIIIACE